MPSKYIIVRPTVEHLGVKFVKDGNGSHAAHVDPALFSAFEKGIRAFSDKCKTKWPQHKLIVLLATSKRQYLKALETAMTSNESVLLPINLMRGGRRMQNSRLSYLLGEINSLQIPMIMLRTNRKNVRRKVPKFIDSTCDGTCMLFRLLKPQCVDNEYTTPQQISRATHQFIISQPLDCSDIWGNEVMELVAE